jgi:hypothetical protein
LTELNSKIKGSSDRYVQANANQNVVQLLAIIQGYCCQFNNHQQSTYMLKGTKHRVSTFYQSYNTTTLEYVEHFRVLVGVVETYGGVYGNELGMIRAQLMAQGVVAADLHHPNLTKLKKAKTVCWEEYLLCMILQGLDNTMFYQLKIDLANSIIMKKNEFPKTMVETQLLLNDYIMPPRQQCTKDPDRDGVTFVQNRPPGKARSTANIEY